MPSSASFTSPAAATPTYVDFTFTSTPSQYIGPPNWNQLVYVGGGYPYYRPNSDLVLAIFLLVSCVIVSTMAAIMLRLAKRKNDAVSIVRELLTFRYYWTAMLCSIITYGYALIEGAVHAGSQYVQQRSFLVQFIFAAFDYAGCIFLLLTIYALVFRLMRNSPLGSGWLSTLHFGRYRVVRDGLCVVLGVLAVLIVALSLGYLTRSVFTSGDSDDTNVTTVGEAALYTEMTFGSLYFLAASEVLVVSSRLVRTCKKNRLYSRRTYVANLIIVSIPLFIAAVARMLVVFWGQLPFASYPGILTGIPDIFGSLSVLCSLYGVVYVAANADASVNRALIPHKERGVSLDVVVMDRDPEAVHAVPSGVEA